MELVILLRIQRREISERGDWLAMEVGGRPVDAKDTGREKVGTRSRFLQGPNCTVLALLIRGLLGRQSVSG